MTLPRPEFWRSALGWLFTVHVFALSVSIALAQSMLGLSLFCCLILVLQQYRQKNHIPWRGALLWFYRIMGMYVLWLAISAVAGRTPIDSLAALREEWLFAIVPVAVYLLGDTRMLRRLMLAMAAGIIVSSLYALSQLAVGYDWLLGHAMHTFGGQGLRLSGMYSYPITFGNVMAVSSTFLLGYAAATFRDNPRSVRWLLIGAAVLGVVLVALANSRGPLGAMILSLIVFGWLFGKIRYIVTVIVVGVAIALLAFPGMVQEFRNRLDVDSQATNERGRIAIFRNSLKLIEDQPIFGVGLGNFESVYATHVSDPTDEKIVQKHAHNDFLNVAAVGGVPLLVLFVIMWGIVLRFLWLGIRRQNLAPPYRALAIGATLGSVAFLAGSMTEATFADEEVRQLLMFVWACAMAGWYHREKVQR